jgi:hypothetical protein
VDRVIERVAVGRHDDGDVRLLCRQLEVLPSPGSFRLGRGRLAMDHGDHVQIGDQHYYGLDVVRIRGVLAEVVSPRHERAVRGLAAGRVAGVVGPVEALAAGLAGGLDEILAGDPEVFVPGLALLAGGGMLLRIARVLRDPGES